MRRTLSPSFSASKMKMAWRIHPLTDYDSQYEHLCPILTQMIPLIKRSTDNLVAVIGEKGAAEVTFESME